MKHEERIFGLALVALVLLVFFLAAYSSRHMEFPNDSRFMTIDSKEISSVGRGAHAEMILKDKISGVMYIETYGGVVPLFNQDGTAMKYEDWLKERANDNH